jgi:tripartite-type tricarboxylate transporter receptor subunit TctC
MTAALGGGRFGMRASRLIVALGLALGPAADAYGQPAPDFYKNKQMRLIVGHAVGNDYDVGGRLLMKHLPRYIPGQPTIIVQNMPQAASIVAANYVYTQAPRDGTVIGSFSRNFPISALLGGQHIEADPRRFLWLGATSFPGRICAVWHTMPIRTPADLLTHELVVGGTGAGSSLAILPTVFNHVLGAKFRVVEGYRSTQEVILAAERGEVHGLCASLGQFRSHDRLLREGKLRIIWRAEEAVMPEIPDVPSVYDYAKTEEQRQFMRILFSSVEFGRFYVFPPGVPKERADLLRQAIGAALKDPELIADAEKMKLDMSYRSPEHLERLIAQLYATPPAVIEAVKKVVPNLL